jgi:hypothetical protein
VSAQAVIAELLAALSESQDREELLLRDVSYELTRIRQRLERLEGGRAVAREVRLDA